MNVFRVALLLALCVVSGRTAVSEDALKALRAGDYKSAAELMRPAAEAGDARAQAYMGFFYERGQGVPLDAVEAAKWVRKSADQGRMASQTMLAFYYLNGSGVKHDDHEALGWFLKAADQGDRVAQLQAGNLYSLGRGAPKDMDMALGWIRKAADQDQPDAQAMLGVFYAMGQGVPRDDTEALKWLRKSAAAGNVAAQKNMEIVMKRGGATTAPDLAGFPAAHDGSPAQEHNPKAQYLLGLQYETGALGLPADPKEAVKWYERAAADGYAPAQIRLGALLMSGKGVEKDEKRGVELLRAGAAQGLIPAEPPAAAPAAPAVARFLPSRRAVIIAVNAIVLLLVMMAAGIAVVIRRAAKRGPSAQ
jgi:TPR repeat protein